MFEGHDVRLYCPTLVYERRWRCKLVQGVALRVASNCSAARFGSSIVALFISMQVLNLSLLLTWWCSIYTSKSSPWSGNVDTVGSFGKADENATVISVACVKLYTYI